MICRTAVLGRVACVVASLLTFNSTSVFAQDNSWINPTSGNWDDATSWSLGALPNSSQSVMITNAGFKAVAIDSSTPINFPGSMTVSNLTIMSPTNGQNTLLMNYVGAGNPLVVGVSSSTPGSLFIDSTSAMVMYSSGLIVNNVLGANNARLGGFEVDGTFTQSDSAEVVAGFLDLNGAYNLTNGQAFIGTEFVNGSFNQQGGTNEGSIIVNRGYYDLNDGTVSGGTLALTNGASFNEYGGLNTNGGTIMTGTTNYLNNPVTSIYTLQEGILETPFISMTGSSFNHNAGTNIVGSLSISNAPGGYVINSGLLTVNQIVLSGSSFSDNGGTLTGTPNLAMGNAYWSESHASMQLGQLQLLTSANAFLYLVANPCVLQFTDSSSIPWPSDGHLMIVDWAGSLNGGGSSQLIFGTSASGLTAQQLSQVQFFNPAGLPMATYPARILSNGEVVPNPNQVIPASISFSPYAKTNIEMTWPSGWTLQSATNVAGPYTDITGATSPYLTNTTFPPQQFFRLRH